MAVPAAEVANVVRTATANAGSLERARQQATAADDQAGTASGFDVWSHTAAGMGDRMSEDPDATDRALAEGASGEWARADSAAMGESLDRQAADALKEFQLLTGQREPEEGEAAPEGFLGGVGATFGVLTSLEQMISAPLSVLPFPAFPAIRVTDMDVGLPHGHTHWPNVPPTPPAPLPSTGPIIPIPFLSGATTTLINGMPAARCGDMGLGVWCGGYFPMYEVFLGSSSVWIEGARAGRLLVDVTRHCMFSSPKPQDPPLGPMVGMTVTSSPNVLIGGVPMPSLLDMAMGAAIQGLFKGISKAVKKVKAARAARAGDDMAAQAARNTSGSGATLPRPTKDSYWRRLLTASGDDVGEAIRRRARARQLVDGMMHDGKIRVGGDDAFQDLVVEDLYLMASTRTGRETLERIGRTDHDTYIDPLTEYRAKSNKPNAGPCAGPRGKGASFDEAAGTPGGGSDSTVYYDPATSSSPNTPPDATLNHELGHAANNAEGMNRGGASPEVLDQPHMTPDQRAAMPRDDLALDDRWTHLEEQNVIRNQDNPYRAETGLPQRFGHGDLEGLSSSGRPVT